MQNKELKVVLSFEKPEDIKKFIAEHESDLYSGKNVEGQDVIVKLEKGKGMVVEVLNSKGWWDWNEYDEDGFVVGNGVIPSREIEQKYEKR